MGSVFGPKMSASLNTSGQRYHQYSFVVVILLSKSFIFTESVYPDQYNAPNFSKSVSVKVVPAAITSGMLAGPYLNVSFVW